MGEHNIQLCKHYGTGIIWACMLDGVVMNGSTILFILAVKIIRTQVFLKGQFKCYNLNNWWDKLASGYSFPRCWRNTAFFPSLFLFPAKDKFEWIFHSSYSCVPAKNIQSRQRRWKRSRNDFSLRLASVVLRFSVWFSASCSWLLFRSLTSSSDHLGLASQDNSKHSRENIRSVHDNDKHFCSNILEFYRIMCDRLVKAHHWKI